MCARHPDASKNLVRAGASFHRTMMGKALGETGTLDAEWKVFLREWLAGAR